MNLLFLLPPKKVTKKITAVDKMLKKYFISLLLIQLASLKQYQQLRSITYFFLTHFLECGLASSIIEKSFNEVYDESRQKSVIRERGYHNEQTSIYQFFLFSFNGIDELASLGCLS